MKKLNYLFAVLALSALGCTRDAVFVIDIAAPETLNGQENNITRLRATLSNAGAEDVLLYPEDGPVQVTLPTDFSFSLPKERAGDVEVFVEALDANENVIGVGSGSAEIAYGQRTRFLINLSVP